VTGRALLFFLPNISDGCAPTTGFFAFRQFKNVRPPLGPGYIATVALKAMAEAGIDTAEWKAQSLRGAAVTHFMARVCLARFFRHGAAGHLRSPWLPTTLENIS